MPRQKSQFLITGEECHPHIFIFLLGTLFLGRVCLLRKKVHVAEHKSKMSDFDETSTNPKVNVGLSGFQAPNGSDGG